MQPLQYELRCPAAKDKNSIPHAAVAPSNLDAATTTQSAETELQSTIELHATALEIAAPNLTSEPKKERRFWQAPFKRVLKGKSPKLRKSAGKSVSQCWCSHSSTIYDVQLQKTKAFRTQPWRQATLRQPLHCDLRPLVAEHRGGTDYTRSESSAAAPAAHMRYLSSPAEGTLHGKTQVPCNIHAAITLPFATRESTNE